MAIDTFLDDFPKIYYSLDDANSVQVVTDIFQRIILSKEFSDNISFYEKYDIRDGETPEDVSYKFYGTPYLHWLVLLSNTILDPRFEWPLTENNLYKQVEARNGVDGVFGFSKKVNQNNREVETNFLLLESSTPTNPISLKIDGGTGTLISYKDSDIPATRNLTNYDTATEKNETYRSILIIKQAIVSEIITNFKELVAA
jgi:hypothetical protein